MADFVIGDYEYFIIDIDAVQASAEIRTKSSYEDIPSSVTYDGYTYSVTNLHSCFSGCTSLVTSPEIPSSVTNMFACFYGCTSLTTAPVIPDSVKFINSCFENCISLTTAPVIPESVIGISGCFSGCTSLTGDIYIYTQTPFQGSQSCFFDTTKPITLHSMNDNVETCTNLAQSTNNDNVYVNVHPTTPISFKRTQMNYMTNEGLKTLSLQTNADLVQCEVPDLVNGGTITTNVNDALIDLYDRGGYKFSTLSNGMEFTLNIATDNVTVRGTPEISHGRNISNDTYVPLPLMQPVAVKAGETYSFEGYKSSKFATYVVIVGESTDSSIPREVSSMIASHVTDVTKLTVRWVRVMNFDSAYGYNTKTFTISPQINATNMRAYICYHLGDWRLTPDPIDITFTSKITKVGGV